ncbi:MAG: cation:proton antiporter, partial [Patescibacteria group bacterium]
MSVFSWSQLSLPVEIAGLVAGLSLSEVYVRDRITSWFDPLRNFFLVFLFFYVGSQVDVRWFLTDWDKLVVLIVIVILSKTIIGWLSAGIAGFPKKVIFMVGIGLANLSELGFVILPMSYRLGIISDRYLSLYSMLILVSIIFSAIVLHNSDKVCRGACDFFSLLERAKIFNPPIHSGLLKGKKVLVGCHRAGMSVINSLDEYKDLVVLDFDIEVINRLKSRGIEAYYCDATDKRTLLEYEICKAKMIISTIPSIKDNLVLAEHVINECSGGRKPWLVCLAKTESEVRELYNRGADLVLNPYISIATDFVGVITTSNRRLLSNQVKRVQNKLFKL